MNEKTRNLLVGLLGAVAGGVLGYFAFFWALRQRLLCLDVARRADWLGRRFIGQGPVGSSRGNLWCIRGRFGTHHRMAARTIQR